MKLAILVSHPVQYFAPLFRELAGAPDVDLAVHYCSGAGADGPATDEQFSREVQWDIPLLEGYSHTFLKNHSLSPRLGTHFFGVVNWGLPGLLRRERPDALIIHGWAYFSYVLGFIAAKALRIPVWLRMESPWNQESTKTGWRQGIRRRALGSLLIRRADRCLYIGSENRKFYEHYGVPREKLFCTPYGVDNARFRADFERLRPRKSELRSKLGVPADATVFLFAGKLMAKKRPMDLLRALREVVNGYSLKVNREEVERPYGRTANALCSSLFPPRSLPHALVVGDGVLRAECEAYAREHELPVTFAGFKNQTEIGECYMAADVLVLPSGVGETWGLVVNEAMNFELPVVVSDIVGCAPDLCRDGENGFQFPCGDVAALADKMCWFMEHSEERVEMGRRSGQIVRDYSYDAVVQGILAAAGLDTDLPDEADPEGSHLKDSKTRREAERVNHGDTETRRSAEEHRDS